eukprot:gnl/TRDRNA2_/TRDRNA2_92925_c0_seq1.p1 gnl/TRDRNA2_/TRDRNA2_92925_c0~~gnl/TRDRNA2_/TRDRNA2_92925_c0_seq1.p1  ORF type:complete len:259 (-),score=10.37 gnl/TRDRNA2_/TRDRNA2_92925_c0_seq1:14-790(-)
MYHSRGTLSPDAGAGPSMPRRYYYAEPRDEKKAPMGSAEWYRMDAPGHGQGSCMPGIVTSMCYTDSTDRSGDVVVPQRVPTYRLLDPSPSLTPAAGSDYGEEYPHRHDEVDFYAQDGFSAYPGGDRYDGFYHGTHEPYGTQDPYHDGGGLEVPAPVANESSSHAACCVRRSPNVAEPNLSRKSDGSGCGLDGCCGMDDRKTVASSKSRGTAPHRPPRMPCPSPLSSPRGSPRLSPRDQPRYNPGEQPRNSPRETCCSI